MSKYLANHGSPAHCVLRPGVPDCNVMNDTANEAGQWIRIDLGEDRRLILEHYCIRNDCQGKYAIRNWKLQGSNQEAGSWTTLSFHRNDASLPPEDYGSAAWPVEDAGE